MTWVFCHRKNILLKTLSQSRCSEQFFFRQPAGVGSSLLLLHLHRFQLSLNDDSWTIFNFGVSGAVCNHFGAFKCKRRLVSLLCITFGWISIVCCEIQSLTICHKTELWSVLISTRKSRQSRENDEEKNSQGTFPWTIELNHPFLFKQFVQLFLAC